MSAEWRDCQVRDVGTVVTGRTPSVDNPSHWGDKIPFITPSDMPDGVRSVIEPQRWLSVEGAAALKRHLIPYGVGVSCIGWQMGKAILIEQPCVTNQQINSIIPDVTIADTRFLYYEFSSRREEIFRLGVGGSRTPILNKSNFEKLPIKLPPLAEQHAIAAILGALDDKIALNRQMNATLEGMARALFQSWFVDFDPVRAKVEGRTPDGMDAETAALFPASFEDSSLGPVPSGWRVSTIGEELRAVGGSTPSTKEPAYWDEGKYAWATPKDLSDLTTPVLLSTSRQITELGLGQISSGLLPEGTVLLSSRAPVGYLAIAEMPVAINQGFIAMICEQQLSNYYVLWWASLNMDAIKAKANGTTFMEVSKSSFRPISVHVPPNGVIQAFDDIVGPLYQQIVCNERESRTLAETRDALLPKLVSGELRVGV